MKLIESMGRERATACITAALTTVRAYQKFRVNFFEECLRREINKLPKEGGVTKIDPFIPTDRTIVRGVVNPMVRRRAVRSLTSGEAHALPVAAVEVNH